MKKAIIGGKNLAFEIHGTGEPVVLVHGALMADSFRPLFEGLRLTSRHMLITYRRRGYTGSSAAEAGLTMKDQAQDCWALMSHLGIERAHVVGHSFVGSVPLQLALDEPDVVHTLVLLEPALMIGRSAQGYRDSLLLGIQHFRETNTATVVDEMLRARWPDYQAGLEKVLPGAFRGSGVRRDCLV